MNQAPHTEIPNAVAKRFAALQAQSRKALIPFFTAGYPSPAETMRLALTASSAGADLLELGMPFSDPLADGPAIQQSSHEALESGLKMKDTFNIVEKVTSKTNMPVVLMGYYNPIGALGVTGFVRSAKSAGVSGLIVPDLPPEESGELRAAAEDSNMALTFLIAPTTTLNRYQTIADSSTGFVYAVTVAGVTGARRSFATETDTYLQAVKRNIAKPVVAGFGIANGESARRMARRVDGVVVGSAFIELQRTNPRVRARTAVGRLVEEIRKSLDSLDSGVIT